MILSQRMRAQETRMKNTWIAAASAIFIMLAPTTAFCGASAANNGAALTSRALAKIVPGRTTKADMRSLFGAPWRVVQFNDCGEAMDDQADETWEYRGTDTGGAFRLHVEFDDNGVVHLVAKIPDAAQHGKGTVAKVAPGDRSTNMSM
jgi:hypothetical protein